MMRFRSVAILRVLPAVLFTLLFSSPARGASLHWEQLQGRERITLSTGPSEGIAGTVGRIAPNGVLIPFTSVPSGMHMAETPQGASIIQGTRQQGRALVLLTQTPAFGFVVSRQTEKELAIDFFPDPLGARWKPTTVAPTTELPPPSAVQEMEQATAQAAAEPPPSPGLPEQRRSEPQNSPVASPPALVAATPSAPALQPSGENVNEARKPAVVNLSGSPEYAARAIPTQRAEPPAFVPPPSMPPQPQPGQAAATVPQPVAAVAAPMQPAVPLSANQERSNALPTSPAMPPVAQSSSVQQTPKAPAAQPSAALAQPSRGVGMPSGQGAYSGEINLGGMESIYVAPPETSPAQPPRPVETRPVSPATAPTVAPAPTPPVQVAPSAPQAPPQSAPQPATQAPVPSAPAPSAPERQAPAAPAATAEQSVSEPATTVVYTDSEGKPVPPPPEPSILMPEILADIKAGSFAAALEKTDSLLNRGFLDRDQREELLHIRSEMLFAVNKDNIPEHFREISDAANQAINFNPSSPRNAPDYLRLGYVNLKMGNIPEAEARFNLLRRMYPNDENVPLTYYYWGDYHFNRNELQKAADEFQYILQEYPNSRYAREGALGLARAYYRLGYYEQSFNVVDYVERRWEHFYIEYPPFLNMMGDVGFRLDKQDYALKHYWLYVNLEPFGDEADIILTRIGDIYFMQRERAAAKEMYQESATRFPDKDGGLVALMRLAEDGVNDTPTISGMFTVFDGPYNLRPVEVYRNIITKNPQSSLVPLAEVKLALWHLWNKDYEKTLDLMSGFLQKYPKHELAPRAKEVALQTFAAIAAQSTQEERYAYMREIWEKYPIVREQGGAISPESRIALAVSYRYDGHPNEALQTVDPFFLGQKVPAYSEMALSLVLSIYLEYEQWHSIREVSKRVELWELDQESRQQLDYALALAAENLDESDKAAPIWKKLYESGQLGPSQSAYATYFLARHAERQRELEQAYLLGREALNKLIQQVEHTPSAADVGKIQTQLASLMDVAETSGRLREALGFALQYLEYLPADASERTAVQYRMSRVYKKQGDLENWRKTLTQIAAQDPASVYGQLATSELNAASIAEDAARYSPTGRL